MFALSRGCSDVLAHLAGLRSSFFRNHFNSNTAGFAPQPLSVEVAPSF